MSSNHTLTSTLASTLHSFRLHLPECDRGIFQLQFLITTFHEVGDGWADSNPECNRGIISEQGLGPVSLGRIERKPKNQKYIVR